MKMEVNLVFWFLYLFSLVLGNLVNKSTRCPILLLIKGWTCSQRRYCFFSQSQFVTWLLWDSYRWTWTSCLWLCSGGRPDCSKVSGCPRLLHYSASLHLVDMLPPPPPVPTEDATDSHSLTSDEGLETHSLRPTGWAMQADKQKMLMHWFFSTTLGRQHVDGLMCVWIICRCSKLYLRTTTYKLLALTHYFLHCLFICSKWPKPLFCINMHGQKTKWNIRKKNIRLHSVPFFVIWGILETTQVLTLSEP